MTVKISHYKYWSGGGEPELMIHATGIVDVWWDGKIVDKISMQEALHLINRELETLLDAKKQLEGELDLVTEKQEAVYMLTDHFNKLNDTTLHMAWASIRNGLVENLCNACGQPLTGCTNSDCDASIG